MKGQDWRLDSVREAMGNRGRSQEQQRVSSTSSGTNSQVHILVWPLSGCVILGCYVTSLCLSLLIHKMVPKWQVPCEADECLALWVSNRVQLWKCWGLTALRGQR